MTRFRFGALSMMALALAACAGSPATPGSGQNGKFKVVATYSLLGDFVQNVGGEAIDLRTLVGPGGDAHEFQPSPADAAALAEAAVVVENGLGFEPWLDDLYGSSGTRAVRVVVADGIKPITAEGHADEPGESDPHVWHDVTNGIRMVENIRDGLVQADPERAESYRANADRYITRLRELDQWVQGEVARLPETRRKLVTTHDTFRYFAERYGFEVLGTALGSVSTEVADPSAGEIADLIEDIKAAGVPAIFVENVVNPRLMEQIAAEAGVSLAPTLYTDALGAPGSDGDTYIGMVRYNVAIIVEALSP